jgi:general nucleoside transport system ATP-binding protein
VLLPALRLSKNRETEADGHVSLELRDIHKSFGSIRANDGVSLELAAGEIHGLLGENGAGKSTLMKILSGFLSADAGEIMLEGRPLRLSSPRDAIAAGIGMLHQDPLVFLPLSVADNLLLGSPGRPDRRRATRELAELRERYGFSLQPGIPARMLTIGERQQLEIARLLRTDVKVLILDEPTTGISAEQRTTLFSTLRSLAADGLIVIFVSHKLEEVDEICKDVAVMRSGKLIGKRAIPCPADELVELMFGKVVVEPEAPPIDLGKSVLRFEDVTLSDRGLTTRDVSLEVRQGEVIGLAGLEGSGQRTFLRACTGIVQPDRGRIFIGERDMTGSTYRQFRDEGVYYMSAGRLEEGLLPGMTITEHVLLSSGGGGYFIDWKSAEKEAARRIEEFSIRGTPRMTADTLSGGNQQRLLLALTPPDARLLLLEHPTRGLDIESTNWVWSELLERRQHGSGIVFASADLEELLRYSDRILVFFAGRVLRVLDTRTTTVGELGRLIGGLGAAA